MLTEQNDGLEFINDSAVNAKRHLALYCNARRNHNSLAFVKRVSSQLVRSNVWWFSVILRGWRSAGIQSARYQQAVMPLARIVWLLISLRQAGRAQASWRLIIRQESMRCMGRSVNSPLLPAAERKRGFSSQRRRRSPALTLSLTSTTFAVWAAPHAAAAAFRAQSEPGLPQAGSSTFSRRPLMPRSRETEIPVWVTFGMLRPKAKSGSMRRPSVNHLQAHTSTER